MSLMVYGFRLIGRGHYSEWGFESIDEARKRMEELLNVFRDTKTIEIFEKSERELRVIENYNSTKAKGTP